jgi:hypothetical protein
MRTRVPLTDADGGKQHTPQNRVFNHTADLLDSVQAGNQARARIVIGRK